MSMMSSIRTAVASASMAAAAGGALAQEPHPAPPTPSGGCISDQGVPFDSSVQIRVPSMELAPQQTPEVPAPQVFPGDFKISSPSSFPTRPHPHDEAFGFQPKRERCRPILDHGREPTFSQRLVDYLRRWNEHVLELVAGAWVGFLSISRFLVGREESTGSE